MVCASNVLILAYCRVFLHPWFGEPVVCTLDSRGFRHFRGFRDFGNSSTQLLVCSCLSCLSGTKIQPKEEVFGRTSLRTSRQKLLSGPPNPGKQAFRNGHPARTSMKKLRSEKLRADFSFPSLPHFHDFRRFRERRPARKP